MGSIDKTLRTKEEELDKLTLDDQIAEKKRTIAEKKALEARAKKEYGRDWKNILGVKGGIRLKSENMQTLSSTFSELKNQGRPGSIKIRA